MTYLTPSRDALASGRDLIAAERRRQIEVEGWPPEHDRAHGSSKLLRAAEAYEDGARGRWPWDEAWWKPKDALSNLIRAGALYQAAADVAPEFDGAAKAGIERCAGKIDALLSATMRALIASGAVIDATTLADDEALTDAVAEQVHGAPVHMDDLDETANVVRALAAALTEREGTR